MGQGRYPTAAEKTARHTRQEYNRRCGLLDPQPAAPRLVFSRRVANLLPVCSHATHRKKRCSRHMQTFFSRGSGDAALDLGTWLLAFWQAQSRDGSDRLRGAHLCGVARALRSNAKIGAVTKLEKLRARPPPLPTTQTNRQTGPDTRDTGQEHPQHAVGPRTVTLRLPTATIVNVPANHCISDWRLLRSRVGSTLEIREHLE